MHTAGCTVSVIGNLGPKLGGNGGNESMGERLGESDPLPLVGTKCRK